MSLPAPEDRLLYRAAPTRARHWVVVLAATLAVITYMDRVCISQAKPDIQKEFQRSDSPEDVKAAEQMMGWAFLAFFWTYALFEIPGGWLGDRWGARRILMRVVVWWSCFTGATGWAWNWTSLIVTRAMFGAGEAGCFPNLARAFVNWLPAGERVRAQGIMWLSARWGGAFTPLVVVWCMGLMGWRWTFVAFGLVGVVWAAVFFWWYRDDPHAHPAVSEAERALLPRAEEVLMGHGRVPWHKFLTSPTVLLLWAQYTFLGCGWVFYITWLPTYLKEAWELDITKSALLAGFPLFFGGLGSLFCGLVAARLDRWLGSVRRGRRCLACVGFGGATLFLVLAANLRNPWLAMLAMGMSSFSNDLVMPPSWGACMDVGRKYCGTLSGSMNMMTNLGQGVWALVIPAVKNIFDGDWNVVLFASAGVYFLGMLCWFFIDPVTPLDAD